MHKVRALLLSAVCGVVLLSGASAEGISAAEAPKYIPVVKDIAKQEQEAWDQACLINQYDCTTLERPTVVYEDMEGWGYFTYFPMPHKTVCSQEIHVDASVKGQEFATYIMIHEYTHVMQCDAGWMTKKSTALRSSCERVRMAFWAENVAAIMNKFEDLRVDTWEEIKWAYGCK